MLNFLIDMAVNAIVMWVPGRVILGSLLAIAAFMIMQSQHGALAGLAVGAATFFATLALARLVLGARP
jgi:hypothetical protein